MNEVEEIKKRLPIQEVVGSYLELKKAGSGLTALCPFHNEKTPSFHVAPDKGIYKCFGCGESGDIFSFVEKYEAVDFSTALKKLADRAGVKLVTKSSAQSKKQRQEEKEKKEKYFHILDDATTFWQKQLLENKEVKEYLKKRGVQEETVRQFRLGYAPEGWQETLNFLTSRNFDEKDIAAVGLIVKKEKKVYDRFRQRLIFPIFDEQDRVIGFSGRDLSGSDKVAKYLNSPQNDLFDKSAVLYGFNWAKTVARKRDYFILTEGQMDLVMSHQVSFSNTVATSGTALTEQHLSLLKRFSDNLIFAFDSDQAGLSAAWQGIKKALAKNMDVKILNLEEGKDPADLILEDPKQWPKIVKNSQNIILFYIQKIISQNTSVRARNKEMTEKILPLVAEVPNSIEKGHYLSKIAAGFDTTVEAVEKELDKVREKLLQQEKESKEQEVLSTDFEIFSKSSIIDETKKKILKELTAIYFWQQGLAKANQWIAEAKVLKTIKQSYSPEIFEKVINLPAQYRNQLVLDIEHFYADKTKENFLFDLEDLKDNLEKIVIKEQRSALQRRLLTVTTEKDKSKILKQIQDLNTKI